ncbi:MAG: hypothetical protein ABIJ41_03875 [Candidatus Omnitrophota bacterium]
MFFRKIKKGQSTVELAMLVIIVIGAFVAIQMYIKRGIQGRWKDAVDQFGSQYDPTVMTTNVIHRYQAEAVTDIKTVEEAEGYWTNRIDTMHGVETRVGASQAEGY